MLYVLVGCITRRCGRRQASRSPTASQKEVNEILVASISDVQTAIGANDSKASAALIVHGLLVTGVVTLLVHLGSLYTNASYTERLLALIFLFSALAAFLGSIFFLLAALLPYRPKKLDEQMRERHPNDYLEVFFPLRLLSEDDPILGPSRTDRSARGERSRNGARG